MSVLSRTIVTAAAAALLATGVAPGAATAAETIAIGSHGVLAQLTGVDATGARVNVQISRQMARDGNIREFLSFDRDASTCPDPEEPWACSTVDMAYGEIEVPRGTLDLTNGLKTASADVQIDYSRYVYSSESYEYQYLPGTTRIRLQLTGGRSTPADATHSSEVCGPGGTCQSIRIERTAPAAGTAEVMGAAVQGDGFLSAYAGVDSGKYDCGGGDYCDGDGGEGDDGDGGEGDDGDGDGGEGDDGDGEGEGDGEF